MNPTIEVFGVSIVPVMVVNGLIRGLGRCRDRDVIELEFCPCRIMAKVANPSIRFERYITERYVPRGYRCQQHVKTYVGNIRTAARHVCHPAPKPLDSLCMATLLCKVRDYRSQAVLADKLFLLMAKDYGRTWPWEDGRASKYRQLIPVQRC